ncbi:family 16 glycoside hydrolase [Candidatus Poribacteria bacterium]
MGTIRIPLLSILTILLMVLATGSFAGVWEDNFDDGNVDDWNEISGDWEVKDGIYQQTTMTAEYQKSINGTEGFTDYTLEVDVTIVEGGGGSTSICAGVLMRTDATGSAGYRFWVRNDTNGFQFSVWMENTFKHVIVNAAEVATPGQVYHLKVQIEGFNISAWVDDRIMVEDHLEADGLFPSGLIGLINYNSHAQYDNLTISGADIIAVAPAGKLATKWGSIKN